MYRLNVNSDRWLRIWNKNSKIRNGGYNMADKKVENLSNSDKKGYQRVFFITDYEFGINSHSAIQKI